MNGFGETRLGWLGIVILDPYLTQYIKLKSKYFKNLNVKQQSFKTFKENTFWKYFWFQSGKGFLSKKKEEKPVNKKMNNFDCSET